MKDVSHIFQLTKSDIREFFNGANPKSGFCITIDKTSDGITIGIDKKALALAINGFFRNGGTSTNAANCTDVSFDPPS